MASEIDIGERLATAGRHFETMRRTFVGWAREELFSQVHFPGAAGMHPLVKCCHRDETERIGGLPLAVSMNAPPQLLHINL